MAKITISVGGGKGGVGKSLVALNLSIALARSGRRTVLVDGDLGGANVHTLLGVDHPERTLPRFIRREVESLAELLSPTGIEKLCAIFGGDPHAGDANPRHQQKHRLLRHLWALDADAVVTDVGAGTGFNELDLFNAATHQIIVISPQTTSAKNAYAFAKAALYRQIGQLLPPRLKDALEARPGEPETVDALLGRIRDEEPDVADRARLLLDSRGFSVVGNMASTAMDRAMVGGIARLVRSKLSVRAEVVCALRATDAIGGSVNARRPFLLSAAPGDPDAEAFRALARRLSPAEDLERDAAPAAPGAFAGLRIAVRAAGQTAVADEALAVGPEEIECRFAAPPPRGARVQILVGPTSRGERIVIGAVEAARRPAERTVLYALVDVDDDGRDALATIAEEGA